MELIEKLEENTAKTTKLQDEIKVLISISTEKDLEIESLKSKQVELETQRKEFTTKLTDWEVSYETIKNKAKLREQELLSLLEEQRSKQADAGKCYLVLPFLSFVRDPSKSKTI